MGRYYIGNMPDWDYGELSKIASKHGGPKRFINKIFSTGAVAGAVSTLIISGGVYYLYLKRKEMIKNNENIILNVE